VVFTQGKISCSGGCFDLQNSILLRDFVASLLLLLHPFELLAAESPRIKALPHKTHRDTPIFPNHKRGYDQLHVATCFPEAKELGHLLEELWALKHLEYFLESFVPLKRLFFVATQKTLLAAVNLQENIEKRAHLKRVFKHFSTACEQIRTYPNSPICISSRW
jgi:hypothetical protein